MRATILVVDDEVYVEKLIKMRFRKEIKAREYVFHYALNGQEALDRIQEHPETSIILCDINMPVMDGFALLDELVDFPGPLKIIMVTAYGNMDNIRSAMNRGAFDFINKPIDIPDLKKTIDKAAKELEQIKEGEEARKQLPITQQELEETDRKARYLEELNQFKNQFFTNISHEFRTPLTIIRGMVDQIEEDPDRWLEKGKTLIRRNTNQLLDLVNQILDLQKLESGKLDLNLIQGNIAIFLSFLSESFRPLAEHKGISLSLQTKPKEIWMDYDAEKMLRIFSNLLSNAIKFTSSGGKVDVRLTEEHQADSASRFLVLLVSDTGIGIPQDKLAHIFTRFYQVDGSSTRAGEGTGIGLSLTQELVQLMSGKIEADSTLGVGTSIRISLPITNEALRETQQPIAVHEVIAAISSAQEEELQPNPVPKEDVPSLLLIEDNPDVVEYLISCLEDEYSLIIARDGEEGIEKAFNQTPDLIISDVMMPGKDGYEVCEILKTDIRTSHIPIVLLTAKADQESRLQGLTKGADAYLAKPFDKEELIVRLKQLHALRERLRLRYADVQIGHLMPAKEFHQEDDFLKRLYACLDEHMDSPEFNVPALCKMIGMSRSNLHRKVKALTGDSIGALIIRYRLQKAEFLLKNTDHSIADIAFELGFNDPSYFSRRFTLERGMSPRQMRNQG